ncbi:MAG: hypothetical protein HC880_04040 [Bacteroidia bacterium]|nr:hypothetical protein [Bacteroidia bacterium]
MSTTKISCNNSQTYVSPELDVAANHHHARKGEAIADYADNGIPGQNYARGAMANGGGGGNSHNGGGGGGANFSRGGNGGYGWSSGEACTGINQAHGLGGYSLDYSLASNKIFMGGAGGAGQQNNNHSSRGGNGGGIILIRAAVLVSECGGPAISITANGENAPPLHRKWMPVAEAGPGEPSL